ncbi:Alpha/Beta hydrolase protein [Lipomyces tetrasporus]
MGLAALLLLVCGPLVALYYLVRRAGTLTALEISLLNDLTLGESPLTQRDGHIITVPHRLPSSGSYLNVSVRVVHISAATPRNPNPANLPVFVLIHGLGGQLAQFDELVDFFAYYADVLVLDLPGCGGAPYDASLPTETYSTPSLVSLISTVIKETLGTERDVILVGHSLGTAMACHLAISNDMKSRCKGIVAICPPAPLSQSALRAQKFARYVPPVIFDVFRYFDRQGGLHSRSVERMMGAFDVGSAKELKIRRRQLRWNLQVNTPVWLAMAGGALVPMFAEWNSVTVPVCLIGAEQDGVAPPEAVSTIAEWVRDGRTGHAATESVRTTTIPRAGHMCMVDRCETVCGIINDFVVACIDQRLSLGWQLADLATRDDKWSLKNEAKWRSVQSVSAIIDHSHFRAMKTLRQDDAEQNPAALEEKYVDITDIIDISRDQQPPYAPASFKRITYHKFPTVSKIPPTRAQVDEFIALVDDICYGADGVDKGRVVAVHCHYGFNRTGFLICAYMVQRMGKPVREAVEDFKVARPPGIKHPHFIDELYVRYTL